MCPQPKTQRNESTVILPSKGCIGPRAAARNRSPIIHRVAGPRSGGLGCLTRAPKGGKLHRLEPQLENED